MSMAISAHLLVICLSTTSPVVALTHRFDLGRSAWGRFAQFSVRTELVIHGTSERL